MLKSMSKNSRRGCRLKRSKRNLLGVVVDLGGLSLRDCGIGEVEVGAGEEGLEVGLESERLC